MNKHKNKVSIGNLLIGASSVLAVAALVASKALKTAEKVNQEKVERKEEYIINYLGKEVRRGKQDA